MNRNDVATLETLITEESSLIPDIRRIGNGEWVAVLRCGGHDFYLWSRDDWHENKLYWRKSLYKLEASGRREKA